MSWVSEIDSTMHPILWLLFGLVWAGAFFNVLIHMRSLATVHRVMMPLLFVVAGVGAAANLWVDINDGHGSDVPTQGVEK